MPPHEQVPQSSSAECMIIARTWKALLLVDICSEKRTCCNILALHVLYSFDPKMAFIFLHAGIDQSN